MTISKRVQKELVQAAPSLVHTAAERKRIKMIKTTREAKATREQIAAKTKGQAWTKEEHQRFLEALQLFPTGPWDAVAEYVGTKNSRQTMTHAQKYRQKFERQQRGLRVTNTKRGCTGKAAASTARQAAQPYTKRVAPAPAPIVTAPVTPTAECTSADTDSPRSAEDQCEELPPIDMDLFTSPDSTKVESMLELFQDFDPLTLQAHMWSTNSLMDTPMESMALDELSALPEDFSQSLGLWVP